MLKLRPSLIIFFIVFVITHTTQAQKVDLELRSGNRIKTTMTEVTVIQMFTLDGVFGLAQIKSAHFWETFPDSTSISKLRKGGVTVYLKREQLEPWVEKDTIRHFNSIASIGIGLGLDYGGFGAKLELLPAAPVGFFGGVGNNLSGVGYNFGLNWKFHPYKQNIPYIIAMYGYNAVYQDLSYYGYSAGFGSKFRMDKLSKSHFSIEALVPFRDKFLRDKIKSGIWAYPVLLSIGFNFNFFSKD